MGNSAAIKRGPGNRVKPPWWSGFDIRYQPGSELAKRMSNPEIHQHD
jgi:hypothetical protein